MKIQNLFKNLNIITFYSIFKYNYIPCIKIMNEIAFFFIKTKRINYQK